MRFMATWNCITCEPYNVNSTKTNNKKRYANHVMPGSFFYEHISRLVFAQFEEQALRACR